MSRIGEDVRERLDIVPAAYFVHRHICGKWVCRCCQTFEQVLIRLQMLDAGIAAIEPRLFYALHRAGHLYAMLGMAPLRATPMMNLWHQESRPGVLCAPTLQENLERVTSKRSQRRLQPVW